MPDMTEPASAPTSAELVNELDDAAEEYAVWPHMNEARALVAARQRLLDRLAAYDALAAAARIEVARADRFGCRELRDALKALDEGEQG